MAGDRDDFQWSIRLDRTYHFKRPGQGARAKAEELATGRYRFERWLDRLFDARTDERAWRRGAVGEEVVGAQLDRLPRDRWAVVHDLTIGRRGANLDHLVVGPPGIFAVNTKHLTGSVTLYDHAILQNGHKTDFVRKGLAEARKVQDRLSRALGQPVRAWSVIVIMGAVLEERRRPANLTVLSSAEVPIWFLNLPGDRIDRGLRVSLERIARSPETWTGSGPQRTNSTSTARSSSTESSDGLVVKPWNRYGKRRLYVNTRQGATLGWFDLAVGRLHVDDPRHRVLVERTITEWRRQHADRA